MKITSTLAFEATPDRVRNMLINPDFSAYIAEEIHADSVQSTQSDQGLRTEFVVASPDQAKRFLGKTMTIAETLTWKATDGDTHTGTLDLGVKGVPGGAQGVISLSPTPQGSTLAYDADFSVRIPLVGKQVEKLARTHLTDIIHAAEKVGNTWLKDNPSE
jgi:hypothetical protein